MEYLPGQSLQDAQHSMTLEEKVCHVIKDVAQAPATPHRWASSTATSSLERHGVAARRWGWAVPRTLDWLATPPPATA